MIIEIDIKCLNIAVKEVWHLTRHHADKRAADKWNFTHDKKIVRVDLFTVKITSIRVTLF